MPPPIRYPLPTLLALVALGLLAWRGADAVRVARERIGTRVTALLTDPVPTEADPAFTGGPLPRRGLVLLEGTAVRPAPDADDSGTIDRPQLVDLLNAWPPRGEPEAYRVGKPTPIGWVAARDILPWDTRLVVHPADPGPGGAPRPIVGASESGDTVEIVRWGANAPWRVVDGVAPTPISEIPADGFQVLVTRRELLELISRSLIDEGVPDAEARALAIAGTLLEPDPSRSTPLVEAVRERFGAILDRAGRAPSAERADALGRLNEDWRPDVSWNGVPLRAIPLRLLP